MSKKLYSAEQNNVVAKTDSFYFEHQPHIKSKRIDLAITTQYFDNLLFLVD